MPGGYFPGNDPARLAYASLITSASFILTTVVIGRLPMKMDMAIIGRPAADEYAPYYGKYVALVSTDDVFAALERQPSELVSALSARKESDGDFR